MQKFKGKKQKENFGEIEDRLQYETKGKNYHCFNARSEMLEESAELSKRTIHMKNRKHSQNAKQIAGRAHRQRGRHTYDIDSKLVRYSTGVK